MKHYTLNSVAFMYLVLFLTGFVSAFPCYSQDPTIIPWHVKTALTRFEMEITQYPSHSVAGIIAVIPDGGILPKPQPKALVFTPAGKLLKSEAVWHNPNEGFGIVFESTDEQPVLIYFVQSNDKIPPPRALITFKPSVLLFARNSNASTNASLNEAHLLADNPAVGPDIYFKHVGQILHGASPVGRDEDLSSYYLGWFEAQKPGKTYFFTISQDGSEIDVDGKLVHIWPGRHTRDAGGGAQHGNWVSIRPGLRKLEYFHFNVAKNDREVQLGWQLPGASPVNDPKFPGMKNKDYTFPMAPDDFIISGTAVLRSVQSRRAPQSIFFPTWISYIHTTNTFICLYQFQPFGAESHPPGTTYEWNFGKGRKVKTKNTTWLYPSRENQTVTLSVSDGKTISKSSRTFFPKFLPKQGFTTNAIDCAPFLDAFSIMCRATQSDGRPCEFWSDTLWNGLFAVITPEADVQDMSQRKALLACIFDRSRPDILKLPQPLQRSLEDTFFEALRRTDHGLAVSWLNQVETEEKDMARKRYWKALCIEFYLYDVGDLKRARIAAHRFMRMVSGTRMSSLAMIRMGDVERSCGNIDKARSLYGGAQELYRRYANIKVPVLPTTKAGPLHSNQSIATMKHQDHIQDWKISAVHEATFYFTVQSLIEQQALHEAKQTLDQWELAFPLNKLAGDYPLAQARYYMARRNYKRARQILMTYRKSVDFSNYLPDSMKLELECLVKLGLDNEARDLVSAIIKRLPNHPLAQQAEALLSPDYKGKLTLDPKAKTATTSIWTETEQVDSSMLAVLFGEEEETEENAETTERNDP